MIVLILKGNTELICEEKCEALLACASWERETWVYFIDCEYLVDCNSNLKGIIVSNRVLRLHFLVLCRRLRLLIHKLRIAFLGALQLCFATEVPAVQIPSSGAQVSRKAQPRQIRCECPASNLIHFAPDIRQIAHDSRKSNDIDGSFDGSLKAEEQRHPNQIESELNRI